MKLRCDNCSEVWDEEACHPASDLSERNLIGFPYSDMECPDCGSLCYPTDEEMVWMCGYRLVWEKGERTEPTAGSVHGKQQ